MEICKSKKKAATLLKFTFIHIHQEDITREKYPAYCITLLQLLIKTARDIYPDKFENNFRLKQFTHSPVINYLVCNQISLQQYCKQEMISHQEGLQIIRHEFRSITPLKTGYRLPITTDTTAVH